MFLAITILSAILACLSASPIPHGFLGFATAASTDTSATAAATETEETVPKIFSLDHGNVGVNFLGFKASAGLGGLLTGNSAGGGLHAEAGTPFGQAAHAGSSGTVLGEGGSAGGLYAGATAGGGVSAVAGLEGQAASSGSYSNTYSGASSGGVYKSKTKIKTYASPVSELESHKAYEQPAVFHKHLEISAGPIVEKEIRVVEEVQPKKTYIERTVIPNYEEKTIFVPSYVEKTIKVPTVVEKKVRVPVAPTIIEQAVDVPPSNVHFDSKVTSEVVGAAPTPVYYTKTKTKLHHIHPHLRKHVFLGANGGFGGGYGGGYGVNNNGGLSGSSSVTYSKAFNADVVKDAFNIPIATLGAVSKLVGGLFGGAGSISVNKSFGVGGGLHSY